MRARGSMAVLLLLGAAVCLGADEKAETGLVRLPLSEYDRLLRAARRPQEKAPLDAAITSTQSVLEADSGLPRLLMTLDVISLTDKPQALALPDLGVVYGVEVSGDGASVAAGESGPVLLRLSRRGRFVLKLKSVPSRDERGGTIVLTWGVPDSPSNRFTATLPSGHESVTLTGGTVSVAPSRAGAVRVTGTLRRSETVRLTYAVAASRAPEEKLLASASEARLYRLGEKTLGVLSRLRIEVLRGTLQSFAVEADPDLTVTSAWVAENTVTSFERDPEKPGRLVLTLARGVTGGTTDVFWLLEKSVPQDRKAELPLPEVGLPDFLRGETTVALISPRPLVLDETKGRREGYERIDETDLPPELREMVDSTILLALRRVGAAAPALAVHVSSFPNAVGLAGVIDRATVLTIAARDGLRIDRWELELQTRESLVRLPLPAGATLWSLQLDGKPVRPLTEQGELIISMGRGEKSARVRNVEIVLATPGGLTLPARGTAHVEMPKLPFPVTHASWDLLLPEASQYRYGGGSVVPIPMLREPKAVEAGVPGGVPGGVAGGYVDYDATSGDKAFNLDGVNVTQGTGRLTGRVADQQGAALPGVTVTITRQEGSYQRTTTTDAQGNFLFSGVPKGTYRILAALQGFSTGDRTVSLSEGGNLGADLKLPLSTVEAAVTVTGEAPLIDSRKVTTGGTVYRAPGPPAPVAPAPAKAAAKEAKQRQVLSDEERTSLQRNTETGVASIQVELPTEGKRLHFEGNLLIDEAVSIELQVRPVKRGWFR